MDKSRRDENVIMAEIRDLVMAKLDSHDSFRLGMLVKEYGMACGVAASMEVLKPILDIVENRLTKPPKPPWET